MRSGHLNSFHPLNPGESFRVIKKTVAGPSLMKGFHYNNLHYELLFLAHGTCRCCIEDRVFLMTDCTTALMGKGSGHFHDYLPDERVYYHVIFNDSYIDYFQRCTSLLFSDVISADEAFALDPSDSKALTALLEEQCALETQSPVGCAEAGQKMNLFFLRLMTCGKTPCPTSGGHVLHSAVLRLLADLRTRYAEPVTLQSEAERLALDKSYFCRLIRRETGMTFTENLTHIRLRAACEMLSHGSSVEQTAAGCGFSDAGYFCRVFKRFYGLTPHAFAVSNRAHDSMQR